MSHDHEPERIAVANDPEAPPVVNGLQLERHATFQRREWRLQRIGWCLWAGLIAAALLGLIGNGPLSSSNASTNDGSLTIQYDRFLRRHDPSVLTLTIRPSGDGQAKVRIASKYVQNLQIERIIPEPMQTIADGDYLALVFASAAEGSAVISLYYMAEQIGTLDAEIQAESGASVRFWQFAYP